LRSDGFRRTRRLLARVSFLAFVIILLGAAAACPGAGRFLIIDEPLTPADALVILAGPRAVRWLEAVDLYREGMAPHLIISPGIIEAAEVEVRAKGIRYPAEADLVRDAMVQLGIPPTAISVLPSSVDNTADEAAQIKQVAIAQAWTNLIVVTSKYHTRRTRYAFEREFHGTGIRVQVRGSRYDRAKPDGWWRSRADLRYVVSELQKLAAYRLGLNR
jgi:uncharacterized SAM-binding protein YcdF (DUF218 family)